MSRSETLILGSGSSRTESGSPVLTRCGDAHPHHLPVASQRPLPCSFLSTPAPAQGLQLLFLRSVSLSEQPQVLVRGGGGLQALQNAHRNHQLKIKIKPKRLAVRSRKQLQSTQDASLRVAGALG